MKRPEIEAVWKYIDEHQDEYVELLKKFCSQPSVSAQNWGMREMAQLVCDEVTRLGGNGRLIETEGNPIVYGKLDFGRERTLMLYNHYDVVPPEPYEKWTYPPFEPTVVGDRMYARGVADNKGSLLSRYCALDAYLKVHGTLPINICFMAEGEEEIGSVHLGDFVKAHRDIVKADAIVWEGGGKDINHGPLQVALGVKGVTCFELRCRTMKGDMHSANASIVPNPAWRLVKALSSMKNAETDEITIDGFWEDVPEITEMELGYLENFQYNEKDMLASIGRDQFINGLTGLELKKALFSRPSMTIQGIQAGYTGEGAKTVLPSYAFCKIDIRTVMGQTPERVLQQVRNHLDNHGFQDVELVPGNCTIPYRDRPDSWLAKAVIQNVEDVYGMPPAVYLNNAGSSGMGFLCNLTGIPALCYGVYNDESNPHAPDENIFLEDYINGMKLSAAVFHDFAEVE
jgi:acetylornithine deacetylase/succinyl-diaminopimelate desuccinylase-like protein